MSYVSQSRSEWHNVVLIQPTSPFVSVPDIRAVLHAVESGNWASAQTITRVKHNSHWVNQRKLHQHRSGKCTFAFKDNYGRGASQKESKSRTWKFGNVVAVKTKALLEQKMIFAQPSKGIPVPWWRAIDCDGPDDFELAEDLIKAGRIIDV